MLKYQPGTKLEVLGTHTVFEVSLGEDVPIKRGEIITVRTADRYEDCYEFEGCRDVGWDPNYVEDPANFKLGEIKNWQEQIEGIK